MTIITYIAWYVLIGTISTIAVLWFATASLEPCDREALDLLGPLTFFLWPIFVPLVVAVEAGFALGAWTKRRRDR